MQRRGFLVILATVLAISTTVLISPNRAVAEGRFKTLHAFTGGVDGNQPYGGVILDAEGNLYGTTEFGGLLTVYSGYGAGTVYKLTQNANGSWSEKVLYAFTGGNDAARPIAPVVLDHAGNLYGTTYGGGGNNFGTVFQLSPQADGAWTEQLLTTSAFSPLDAPILDPAGNLYATDEEGGCGVGSVFELTPNEDGTWSKHVLYGFCGRKNSDGAYLMAGVNMDAAGNLYGTAQFGGAHGDGVVFKLTSNADGTWSEQTLHQFTGLKDGGWPWGSVIVDGVGNLYGTAWEGGNFGYGAVYKLTPNSDGTWSEHILHWFTGGKDGNGPIGDLTLDGNGNLYGTTGSGGAYGYGVVYELTPTARGWVEKVLWAFRGHPGAYPQCKLVIDKAGNLYGTTTGDGSTTFGTVFEITP